MDTVLSCCRWVGGAAEAASPMIFRRFSLPAVEKAELTITGLGYFDASLNGQPVSDLWFQPVVSDYEPRDLTKFLYPLQDQTANRIYCSRFDVTGLLRRGENLLEIRLGGGFYRQEERVAEGPVSFGKVLKTIYRLDAVTAEGTITLCSDGTETWRESEIRESSMFLGETIDRTFRPGPEQPVDILPAPKAELTLTQGAPDREIRRIRPVLLGSAQGKQIYDAGETVSGLVEVVTRAESGTAIRLRFAEAIREDLTLDFGSTGFEYVCASGRPQIMEDCFITSGGEQRFCPRFVWHAFRYFEVEGPIEAAEVLVIHSDVPVTAAFSSDFEGPNFLYESFLRTQLINMHGSIPSDCPHRERLGYTGDGQLCAPAGMLMLDSREFYKKWIQDILDCQDIRTGHVQHTAPLMGGGGGPGGWGCAMVILPWAWYKQYGDLELPERCYGPMVKWIGYLESRCENGLVVREEKDGWCLGDWCTLGKVVIPESYVNSCYLVKSLLYLEEMAAALGRTEDLPRFRALRGKTQAAIRKVYYDPATGHYAGGHQGADAYAVWCGLGDETTAALAAEQYRAMGHFDTGFLGTDILLEVLFQYGHGDVALSLLESRELGSFLYMKDRGATTIWESWGGDASLAHPMFGGCSRHLFTGLLGLRQKPESHGWSRVEFAPVMLPAGKKMAGSLETPFGRIAVELDCTGGEALATVSVPEGVELEIAAGTGYRVVRN